MNKKQKILVNELQLIVNQYGYWSTQVLDFNSTLDFTTMNIINGQVKLKP